MQAAYGQQIYGNQPPTPGAHPSYADAPRGAEGRDAAPPRAPMVPGPGAPMMIPQMMPAPMPVHFQVPPGYMLVPVDQDEAARSGPPQVNKNCLEQGIQRGPNRVSRNTKKQQRPNSEKVSKIFVG